MVHWEIKTKLLSHVEEKRQDLLPIQLIYITIRNRQALTMCYFRD